MKKLIIYVLAFLCLSFIGCQKDASEISTPPFQTYNSPATSAKPTPDHGFIISSQEGSNCVFRKISENGSELWATSLASLQQRMANLSFQTFTPSPDGGCFIAGEYYIDTATYNKSVAVFIKLNVQGLISWTIPFDTLLTAGSHHFYAATIGNDGNYLLQEYVKDAFFYSNLIRVNPEGVILSRFNTGPVVKKILELPDKNLLLLVRSDYNYYLQKIDTSGYTIWSVGLNEYDGNFNNSRKMILSDLIVAMDGTYLLTGYTNESKAQNALGYDFFMEKFDYNGNKIDSLVWPGLVNEYLKTVTLAKDGSIYFTGVTCSLAPLLILTNSPDLNAYYEMQYTLSSLVRSYIMKIDSQLRPIWKKSFGNNFGSEGIAIQETTDGNILLVGNKIDFGNKNFVNLFSLRIDSNGSEY